MRQGALLPGDCIGQTKQKRTGNVNAVSLNGKKILNRKYLDAVTLEDCRDIAFYNDLIYETGEGERIMKN